jgi:CheY-like chemotaxis protein
MKRTLLIIEDDPIIVSIYSEVFHAAGFATSVARDGEEGLNSLKMRVPDVVLLDLQMPKLNGNMVLKAIRSNPATAKLPVVVFTNTYRPDYVREAYASGATKCLMKASCTPADLFDAVEKALLSPTPHWVPPRKKGDSTPSRAFIPAGYEISAEMHGTYHPAIPTPPALDTTKRSASGAIQTSVSLPDPKELGRARRPQPSEKSAESAPAAKPAADAPPPAVPVATTAPTPDSASELHGNTEAVAAIEGGLRGQFQKGTAEIRKELAALSRVFMKGQRGEGAPAPAVKMSRDKSEGDPKNVFEGDSGGAFPELFTLGKRMRSLGASSALAGYPRISILAQGIEKFLAELYSKPKNINVSTLRTFGHAMDYLDALLKECKPEDAHELNLTAVVLAVDDDRICREALQAATEFAGFRSICASTPEIAAALAEENRFDLIFLDVQMPGMTGFELCKTIRKTEPNKTTPVIYVTQLSDFESRAKGSLSGGNDYVAKPFFMMELALKSLMFMLRSK